MSDEPEGAQGAEKVEEQSDEAKLRELIAEACVKHKRAVGWCDDDYGPIVFHKPSRIDLKRFIQEAVGDDADLQVAGEHLAIACAFYPPRSQMGALLEELPGLALTASAELQKIATATGSSG